jgi:hypothetical protein
LFYLPRVGRNSPCIKSYSEMNLSAFSSYPSKVE